MLIFMNKTKSDFNETIAKIKEIFTFQFPYWATILLLVALNKDILRLKFVLMMLILLVATYQKFMTDFAPKWLLLTFRVLLTPLMLIYFFEKELLAIGQHFGW